MATEWQESATRPRKSAQRRGVDREIIQIASRQKQLLRLEQLLACGLSERAVQDRAATGRLFRLYTGIYATHPPPHSRHQRYLAGVYACGEGSLLTGLPSAYIHDVVESAPLVPEVTNEAGRGRSRPGIVVHRRSIDRRDRCFRHGIPTTSIARTILDCAALLGAEGTEDLIMAADSLHRLNRRRLEELTVEHRGKPGVRHVVSLIAESPRELRSKNERRLFSICREYGVPLPLTNHRIDVSPSRHFYADFLWPELSLIVEADSWRWHGGRQASEDDTDRDQLLAIAGFLVVHFTRDQIRKQRAETGRRLVALTRRTP